mmetsp:Transcript_5001/g.9770  ORF Transcript_5001/g.9770 Transcript_5001/m.9770 type:complete len:312 (-) Transcript_5001:569-1504(-)
MYNIPFDTRNPLLPQRIPEIQRRLPIPTPHNSRIHAIQIINPLLHLLHVFFPGQCNPAGHGTPQHLVPAHGDRIDGLLERYLRSPIHERHHHGEQRTITVNVEPLAGNAQRFEYPQDAVQVIHGALDGGPDVHVDDHGTIAIRLDLARQRVVIDFPHGQGGYRLGVHPVVPRRLEDAVMCLTAGVQDAVGVALPREEDAVEVPLRAAGGDVAPVGVLGHLPQVGEEVDDGALELAAVHAVIGRDEGVAQVVDGVLHEFVQFLVVVHEVVRVAEVYRTLAPEELVVAFQNIRFVGDAAAIFLDGGDADHFGT